MSRQVLSTWDTETRNNAKEQARGIRRDDEAQAMLEAHIAASSPVAQDSDIHSEHFRPMRLYARVAYFYQCFSDTELRKMHYPRFFGYLREANVIAQEQKDAQAQNNRVHGGNDTHVMEDTEVASWQLVRQFGRPQKYQGETVKLND